jgi:hypothetical protein
VESLIECGAMENKRVRTTFIPAERAVLKQIRELFLEGSLRTYRFNVLTIRWPGVHFLTYNIGYEGLVRKGLVEKSLDGQSFTITHAGMKAML